MAKLMDGMLPGCSHYGRVYHNLQKICRIDSAQTAFLPSLHGGPRNDSTLIHVVVPPLISDSPKGRCVMLGRRDATCRPFHAQVARSRKAPNAAYSESISSTK